MRTIDRYIVRQFLINFAILTFVLLSFFVLVDLVFNLDEFLEAGRLRAQEWSAQQVETDEPVEPGRLLVIGAVLWSAVDFYGPLVLLVFVWLAGLIVVAAMGFTLSAFARSGELVAMVTSGLSMHRLAAPLVVAGGIVASLALIDQELLIPSLAPKLARKRAQVVQDAIDNWPIHYERDAEGNLFSAATFDSNEQSLQHVTVLQRAADGQVVRRITAESARWDAHRQGWNLAQGVAQRRDESPRPGGRAVSRPDATQEVRTIAALTGEPIDFFATSLAPQVLQVRRAELYPELLSLRELGSLMNNPAADAARVQKIMHKRFSLLVVNVLVLVIGLPFFLLREPTNLLMAAVKAACVCLGAWGTGVMLLQADTLGGSPVVAAWLPVVILLPVSVGLMMTIRT